ncbi:holin [Variovorax phage VAC_51]|uniref:Holin n=1 Tax=Variovorax phage VAC_51 TaxID=2985242 RepID=A0A9N6WV73_9CAUD|nr:holin [Variovorax phage VAC_51]
MTIKENAETMIAEAFKATPASATLTLSLFGVPLTQWATILSIVVLLMQAYFLIRNNLGGKNGNTKNEGGERSRSSIAGSSEPDPRL